MPPSTESPRETDQTGKEGCAANQPGSGAGKFTAPSQTKSVLTESLFIIALGGLVALTANHLSPRGLSLTRNYFPGANKPPPVQVIPNSVPTNAASSGTNTLSAAELTAAQLRAKGLQVADRSLALQLFRDPRREQELIVFVDARNEQHYQEGHVPGAYLFDHYRPENHLPALLPVCLTAQTVIVYCTGGNCEDSEFAALALRDAGVAKEKLFVFPGGITEWQTNGLPIETGARLSGNLLPTPP